MLRNNIPTKGSCVLYELASHLPVIDVATSTAYEDPLFINNGVVDRVLCQRRFHVRTSILEEILCSFHTGEQKCGLYAKPFAWDSLWVTIQFCLV